jgi:hypothetical protein
MTEWKLTDTGLCLEQNGISQRSEHMCALLPLF